MLLSSVSTVTTLATWFLSLGPPVGPEARPAHTFEIREKFDRGQELTTLELDLGTIRRDSTNQMGLKVLQVYRGQGRREAIGPARLLFWNGGRTAYRYERDHKVVLLTDDQRIEPDVEYDGKITEGIRFEFLYAIPTVPQFERIVRCGSLGARIGMDEVGFNAERREALRDFARYLDEPERRLSYGEARGWLREARAAETRGDEDEARALYNQVLTEATFSIEAIDAAKFVASLDDPVARTARQQAREAETAARKRREDAELLARIQQKMKVAKIVEARNPRAAIVQYRAVLDMARTLDPEPAPVREARERIKVLEAPAAKDSRPPGKSSTPKPSR